MQVIRPVGRDAAAKKYDLLSAVMAHALAGDKHRQRTVLRFLALVTTRYNWQRDELAIGQAEIARLWCVDERTVKREMARLRGLGWVEVRRAGARGRVTVYGLSLDRLYLDTRPQWGNVGPDFVERMGGGERVVETPGTTVVPFRRPVASLPVDGLWGRICARLSAEDAATFAAWFERLADEGVQDGCLTLVAPSRFHVTYIQAHLLERLRMAARREDPAIASVRLVSPEG